MMLFEQLPKEDIEAIDAYRHLYAIDEYSQPCETAPVSNILHYWDTNKQWLYHKLGDNFIVKQPIEFREGLTAISQKIGDKLYSTYSSFTQILRNLFPYPWNSEYSSEEYNQNRGYYDTIDRILSPATLAKNRFEPYDDSQKVSFLPLADGTLYKFQTGTKPMKIIKKLVDSYNLDIDFEHFRNDISTCLQTKVLKGNLCLSIHPLDFMTMSDNACGWTSCMNWKNNGEYHLGTVEMMNSRCVLEAYLDSEETLCFGDHSWNSKKWRCLFIANNDFIISIKSYPYYNENLTKLVMTKIAEQFGWGTIEPTKYDYDEASYRNPPIVQDKKFYITTETDNMYNDFGTTDHWVIINPATNREEIIEDYYNYSGEANCMNCGEPLSFPYDDEYGCYENCITCGAIDANFHTCDECGDRVSDDESYLMPDGREICKYCYNDIGCWNNFDDRYDYREDCLEIALSVSDEGFVPPKDAWKLAAAWGRADCLPGGRFASDFFKEGAKVKYDEDTDMNYVCPSELTDAGLRIFGFFSKEALTAYMNS